MPVDGGSSTAIVIDDDDQEEGDRDDDDELFMRDENEIVEVDDAAFIYNRNSRGQSTVSYVQDSELRPSDL